MHDDDPSQKQDTAGARQLIALREVAFEEAMVAFDLTRQRIEDGEDVPPGEVAKLFGQLSAARTKLIDEVREHDKRVAREEGTDPSAPLDLEAIRAEIGCRLDRIRAALDEERLSGDA